MRRGRENESSSLTANDFFHRIEERGVHESGKERSSLMSFLNSILIWILVFLPSLAFPISSYFARCCLSRQAAVSSITGCRTRSRGWGASREDEGNENNLLLVNANKANRSEIDAAARCSRLGG